MSNEIVRGEFRWLRRLFWLYVMLLIFEGSLRKWVLPGYANLLLVIRDPVVFAIYFLAFRKGLMSRDPWILSIAVLSAVAFGASFLASTPRLIVPMYGWRANFLHIPLLFLLPKFLQREDVLSIGKAVLLIAMPSAVLMAYQFLSPRDSWINTTAGGVGFQIDNSAGGIRPAGTFSFITGPVFYYSLVAAFVGHGLLKKGQIPLWLVFGSLMATLVAASVSGSRSMVGGMVVVGLFGLVGMICHPPTLARSYRVIVLGGAAMLVVRTLDIFRKGGDAFARRIEVASSGQEGSQVYLLTKRMFETFYVPLEGISVFGQGLGLGTNVGASMVAGTTGFMLAESEWSRIMMESGLLVGGLFLCYRVAVCVLLAMVGLRAAKKGDMLPMLLAGSGFMLMLNGQLGPPVCGGFIAVCCGLSLAAAAHPPVEKVADAAVTPSRKSGRRITVIEVSEPVGTGAAFQPVSVVDVSQGARRPGRFSIRPE